MDSAKYIFSLPDFSFYQSKMMLSCNVIHISMNLKFSILCWKICHRLFFYMLFMNS